MVRHSASLTADSRPPFMDAIVPLHPPRAVRDIADTLERAGYETWCVGGAVRDALLGRAHLDWDLATQATPDAVRALFPRTFPVGIEFGTVGVLDRAGILHEVTTFRRDVHTDGRHAVVEFGVSLDDDLARRDFTINAIAYSPRSGKLHDPFNGRDDLARRVVRAVGEPASRMREDRLRALRALRFAARFGFTIEPATWQAIVDSAPHLGRLSRERVRQELEKTMDQVRCPSQALELWRRCGALDVLVPELARQPGEAFRAADMIAPPDTTRRRELATARRVDRVASIVLGVSHDTASGLLQGLRFSNREVHWIAHLAGCWQGLHEAMERGFAGDAKVPDAEIRRWAARTGRTQLRSVLRVTYARWMAGLRDASTRRRHGASIFRRALRVAYRDPIELADLAVDGDDLQRAGIAPGPLIGTVLRQLLDLVLEDPARNDRERLLAHARQAALDHGDR